jgi:hypothetical protein
VIVLLLGLAHLLYTFHGPKLSLGLIVLCGYVFLAQRYFFRFPLRAVIVATLFYGIALVAHWAATLR